MSLAFLGVAEKVAPQVGIPVINPSEMRVEDG